MKLPKKTKEKLRKQARKWLEFIRAERGDIKDSEDYGTDIHYMYHTGEISFIEFFFNINEKKKMRTKLLERRKC